MNLPETNFERERDWWNAKAPKEERDMADEAINRALRWREIERNLEGVRTILDIGAATGALRAFLPGELRRMLDGERMQVLRCGGLGTLARLCDPEALSRARSDGAVFESFLSMCEQFDMEILPDGPRTSQRAGLIAVAERR